MTSASDNSFPAAYRIKHQRDFDRVFSDGVVVGDQTLVMHGVRNGLAHSRLGLSIGKRLGKAHERNLAKRWCREVFRTHRTALPPGIDLVVRVRPGTSPSFQSIEKSLPALLRRLDRKLAASQQTE